MRNFPYCPRGKTDGSCTPLSNLLSSPDENGCSSFFCIGSNSPDKRSVHQDRFTACFKNSLLDEEGHWDKRDLIDQMAVMTTALSVDENFKVANDLSESEMRDLVRPPEEDEGVSPFSSPGVWKEDALQGFFGEPPTE